jgi:hypothetical protein
MTRANPFLWTLIIQGPHTTPFKMVCPYVRVSPVILNGCTYEAQVNLGPWAYAYGRVIGGVYSYERGTPAGWSYAPRDSSTGVPRSYENAPPP